jgi:toxin ParE1/3/4
MTEIVRWTAVTFGAAQAVRYRETIRQAMRELASGPLIPGSKSREEIWPGARTIHIARGGRRGRHFLLFRVVGDQTIEISRILHDSMDLRRHAPGANPEDD